jgi:hypothetical protein
MMSAKSPSPVVVSDGREETSQEITITVSPAPEEDVVVTSDVAEPAEDTASPADTFSPADTSVPADIAEAAGSGGSEEDCSCASVTAPQQNAAPRPAPWIALLLGVGAAVWVRRRRC